ncbi:helicase associated domain-containing protein [Arthrobacter sp. ISL-48]|uniref:helicase associated domain-containing protein n=1 Tax=Arthrobacter sp. ISL-48 TaxID=2819110 RepID=UPI001BE4ED2D|nr:helicase associated domain-containing protein [Arthrobacter sp. ISL-48]MBT2530966.1 helicase associated domain-containing protein [Arthrobacter sp. ISL-48]
MTGLKRSAPDPEWVQMYQQGITTGKIAAGAGVAETTVRYHLALAAGLEPSIRDEHRDAVPTSPRITSAGRQNLEDVLALYRAEGRLPTTSGSSARERALGVWLHRRRQEAVRGILSPIYKEALDGIPRWQQNPSTKKADDEARWKQRLTEVADYLAAGNDWPRHNKTDLKEERVLGVWLHGQRIDRRAGRLDSAKEARLDAVIPGWREGRARGRRRRQETNQPEGT